MSKLVSNESLEFLPIKQFMSICLRFSFEVGWLSKEISKCFAAICTLVRNIAGYCSLVRVRFIWTELERKEMKDIEKKIIWKYGSVHHYCNGILLYVSEICTALYLVVGVFII
jgi:hypothetical protein